ncbi:MAG: PKD domain-containing protein, partial [Bacteroidota bacterium]
DSDTMFIHVENNLPADANFSYSYPLCPNGVIDFYAYSYGTYYWDFGPIGTSALRSPSVMFLDTGLYSVSLILTNGCMNTDVHSENVHIAFDPGIKPNVEISFDLNNQGSSDTLTACPNEWVRFKMDGWSYGEISFLWDFGDGDQSYLKNPIHKYTDTGLFEVTCYAMNNCNGVDSAKLWVNIDITTLPISSPMTLPDTICPGEQVFFFDEISDIKRNDYHYFIWFGDGDSLMNMTSTPDTLPFFHHKYLIPGSYDYIFQVYNACGNYVEKTGTIVVDPTGQHETFHYVFNSSDTLTGGKPVCPNDIVEFWALGGTSCIWDFGDGSTDTNAYILHSYQDAGEYDVTLIAIDGCGSIDTVYTTAFVSDSVKMDVWFDISKEFACADEEIDFQYQESNNYTSTLNYSFLWDFGDGMTSTDRNPTHIFSSYGDYIVKLIVTSGCGSDSSVRMIHIDAATIDFIADQTIISPGTNVNFTNLTSNASGYIWLFGDGSGSLQINPSHTYNDFGSFDVTLFAESLHGCTTSVVKPDYIHVHNMQIAQFSVNNIDCYGDNNGWIDISVAGGQPPFTYNWSNGGSSQHLDNLGQGTYSVTVTDFYGASATGSYIINEPPLLSVSSGHTDLTCFDSENGTANLIPSGGVPPFSINWSSGATTLMINNLNTGNYEYTVTDNNGCTNSGNINISAPDTIYIYNNAVFSTTSCGAADGSADVYATGGTGGFTYQWDANAGSQTGTTATNLESGAYSVIVTDGAGCTAIHYVS